MVNDYQNDRALLHEILAYFTERGWNDATRAGMAVYRALSSDHPSYYRVFGMLPAQFLVRNHLRRKPVAEALWERFGSNHAPSDHC